jgi:predicted transport protein
LRADNLGALPRLAIGWAVVGLSDAVAKLNTSAEVLQSSGSANEANTKALLIEPMLAALGWDPGDVSVVEREVKVFDGTFLDYALKLDGSAVLYVEAKGLGENLDDKKFVAQAVNYANNDGVLWCVLTNGRRIKVYKTNEPVAMDRKLLFEVDLGGESETNAEKANIVRLISREAVTNGELARFGERVFTDARVRRALAELAADPPKSLIQLVAEKLGHPAVAVDAMQRSLARILDAPATTATPTATGGSTPLKAPAGPPTPPKGTEYSLEHHLGNKSALITQLFEEVNSFGMALGGDVTRRLRKQYIGYFRGKRSFFMVELQHQRLLVYLALDPKKAKPWNDEVMRDTANIGHFGMGDVEYSLRDAQHLPEVKELVQSAYDAGN